MGEFTNRSVREMLEGDFSSRIHEISSDRCTFDIAAERMQIWNRSGFFSIFNAGTFDLLTINHIVGLAECRTLGAMAVLGINNIETERQMRSVHEVASSDVIRLMITLDTNRALEQSKSRRPEKGGAPKPTMDWSTRAAMLALQSIPTPDYFSRRSAVDFITRHGPDCCEVCDPSMCTNEDNALMTVELQPKMVIVNAASIETVTDIEHYMKEGLLPNTEVVLIKEEDNQYHDPILKGPVKTTTIIERIRS